MTRLLAGTALLAVLVFAGSVDAGRTNGFRVGSTRSSGARPDITVPYLNNGTSMLIPQTGVAPAIIGKPGVGNTNDVQLKPVFNLIYYGSTLSPNNTFGGAMPRPANKLRPNR